MQYLVHRLGRPVLSCLELQFFFEELEGAFAVDRVGPDEPFQPRIIGQAQSGRVEVANLGELGGHPFVRCYAVEVSALDHKRSRRDQRGHLGVIESRTEIEFEDLVLHVHT